MSDTVQTRDEPWMVVMSHPNREEQAALHLRRQDYEAYCPHIKRRVRHTRGSSRDAMRPLFPSYLFVRFPKQGTSWRPILSTVGVRTAILAGDRPSLLRDDFVRALKNREVEGCIGVAMEHLSVGQNVCVAGGALDSLVGEIVDLRAPDRVTVLLNLINGQIKTHLTSDQLRPATL